ncbi:MULTISPECIES: ATP-binding cassette domain-containing protein [unclassified Clostridium]|uniref:ABC transporter ATP-binding protein n=1 Tax=unclassified Clostridium TaxID=2614128 RepID=UPI0011061BDD|nr:MULTISPECIES: ATP-binding cassette domain-containing protein [unclassified Clostridium]
MQLEVRGIDKRFGEHQVLKNVSFSAQSGQALGLLGRNGAGKTTTIRIIMQVFGADAGEILVDGVPIRQARVRIGYLPEERGLYPKKQILEQMVYLGVLRGMRAKQARAAALAWLKRLEMDAFATKALDTLSKGNQQKVQLAATLMHDPEIVILDEPFSGLDPVNAQLLKDVVGELLAAGKVVLFSSHQMSYVEEFCENIAILNGGHIVLGGNLRQIKRGYDRSTVLIQSPERARLEDYLWQNAQGLVLESRIMGEALACKLPGAQDKARLLALLAQSGLEVDGFEVYEPTLSDIFVQYTEEGL